MENLIFLDSFPKYRLAFEKGQFFQNFVGKFTTFVNINLSFDFRNTLFINVNICNYINRELYVL